LYLVEIIRKGDEHIIADPDVILQQNDILVFGGDTDNIAEIINSNTGLVLPEVGMLSRMKRTEIVEIIISQNSTLINKKVKQINFRATFDAAVIAVHRNGETIQVQFADLVLKAGDVLLVYAGEDFNSRIQSSTDFYLMSKIKDFVKYEWYKLVIIFGGTLLIILLSAFNVINLFLGLIIILVTSLILKIANPKEIPRSIDYNLALIIVLSLALGTAMTKTNAADLIANSIISIFIPLGRVWVLFGIYIITTILAAYITNKASVAIIFPIAITIANNLELNPLPFILTVAYASAANFMTPIGYQTNLMVYGPGRYSFRDFFKVGFPLTIIYMITTVTILSLIYF
jgi:di/tricarboxylate transporter